MEIAREIKGAGWIAPPRGKIKHGVLIILLAALAASATGRSGSDHPVSRLLTLYAGGRYFELRDTLAGMTGNPFPEIEFFRAAADNAFNRLDSAVRRIGDYLAGESPDSPRPLAKEAWILLADTYRRSGRYRESAEAQRTILDRFGNELSLSEKATRENQYNVWTVLSDVPAQSVEFAGDSVIRMESRHLPVRVADRIFYAAADTGCNLSVLYESLAVELGLNILEPGIAIQSGTGKWIDGRMAVLPEMRLGEVLIRNAVFLVLPDEFFPIHPVRPGFVRRALLGAPILVALKEVTETRDGFWIIPDAPPPRAEQNMCLFGFLPLVEVAHRGERMPFCLDTGSTATFLHPPYFQRYRAEIRARSRLRKTTMGGVGDERTVKIHFLDVFDFRAGGRSLSFKKVTVHTQVTHSSTGEFFGTLGRDLFNQCSRMTLNFVSMSFILE
jgi:hypothetical protein